MADLLLLLALACRPPEAPMADVPRYFVYAGDELVLTVRAEPGPLTSTAPPPPGGAVVTHPFLSAAARDAAYEHQLRELLTASTSVDDYLARLRAAGFRVEDAD